MTEAEWLACEDPVKMLDRLKRRGDRKLRLLAVACCYLSRRGEMNAMWTKHYEVVERWVDGAATLREVRRVWGGTDEGPSWPERAFEWANDFAFRAMIPKHEQDGSTAKYPIAAEVVPLVHDIFGNPFRKAKYKAAWRTSTALLLATQMYDSREFSAMPILADALQDAGCDNEDVLNHCRDAGATHVRGCWVVDMVLGK